MGKKSRKKREKREALEILTAHSIEVSFDKKAEKQRWKKKKKIHGKRGKIREVSFLDFDEFQKSNPAVTYEVMECFVDMVSGLSYDTMKRERGNKSVYDFDSEVRRKEYSYESLLLIFNWLLGWDGGHYGDKSNSAVEFFMALRHKIACRKIKFSFLAKIYSKDSRWVEFDELVELRKSVTFEEMIQIINYFEPYQDARIYGDALFTRNAWNNRLKKWVEDINRTQDEQGYLTVYRTFRVHRGQKIRKGLTRNSLELEGGAGHSFSFFKASAIGTNAYLNVKMISKYMQTNDKEARKILEGTYMNRNFAEFENDDRYQDTFCVIGEFRIQKENIVIFNQNLGEAEVITDYKKARLIDYTFTNVIHYLTLNAVNLLMKKELNASLNGRAPFEYFSNTDTIFDIVYWYLSKYYKNRKSNLKNAVKRGHADTDDLMSTIKSICDERGVKEIVGKYLDNGFVKLGWGDADGVYGLPEDSNVAKSTGIRQTKKIINLDNVVYAT